jgi:hypothetical protein
MTLGLEGFGLFVLIVYTIFTGLMYRANKKAADAAKSAAETAHDALARSTRPWLGVDGPVTFSVQKAGEDWAEIISKVTVKNFGPSPAFRVGYGIYPFNPQTVTAKEANNLWDEARSGSCEIADSLIAKETGGDVIFPQQTSAYTSQMDHSLPGFSKSGWLFLSGCIAYRDQFDTTRTTHHTKFCFYGRTTKSEPMNHCGRGETAD